MEFLALDVETANPDYSSICQIGIAAFKDDKIVDEWSSLINPETDFSPWNMRIHGIEPDDVADSPKFHQIADRLGNFLASNIVVSHSPFDRVALRQSCLKANISEFKCEWLDTARIARRAWAQFASSGYGLRNVCDKIGIEFHHHDALEDAKAAGYIMLAASKELSIDLPGWLETFKQNTKRQSSRVQIAQDGRPDGPLYGETIVFTGALRLPRSEAAQHAAQLGCTVANSVNQKTTLLCVGDQDIRQLAGHDKSSKHRKAEQLIEKGHSVQIITESDFLSLVGLQQL